MAQRYVAKNLLASLKVSVALIKGSLERACVLLHYAIWQSQHDCH
jgi:hypothetical protein